MPVEIAIPSQLDDVYLHDAPLTKRARLFPLGFPLEIASNSDAVLAAARESWGSFESAYPDFPISLSVTVTEHEDDSLPPRPKFRSHLHLMSIVCDQRNQMICDLARRSAYGWVTGRVVDDTDFLRLHLLESAVLATLSARYLAPIHSALITRNGAGVALCGDSYAGKSTLAYACAREGWTFVSDDGTSLLRHRTDRYAVGHPVSMRLREDAKLLFPELQNHRVGPRPNGERGMEVRTSDLPITTASGCSIDHVVFLRRSRTGRATVNRLSAEDALAWFEQAAFYGPADAQESQRQTYRRLLGAELWELHYSDLSSAVIALDGLGLGA